MPGWLDQILVAAAVLGALGYLAWPRRGGAPCGASQGACGCGVIERGRAQPESKGGGPPLTPGHLAGERHEMK